jgi:hypothetical protein
MVVVDNHHEVHNFLCGLWRAAVAKLSLHWIDLAKSIDSVICCVGWIDQQHISVSLQYIKYWRSSITIYCSLWITGTQQNSENLNIGTIVLWSEEAESSMIGLSYGPRGLFYKASQSWWAFHKWGIKEDQTKYRTMTKDLVTDWIKSEGRMSVKTEIRINNQHEESA